MGPIVSRLDDQDMQKAPAALLRAAKRARQIAQETGTELVVIRDGELVREVPKPTSTSVKRRKFSGR